MYSFCTFARRALQASFSSLLHACARAQLGFFNLPAIIAASAIPSPDRLARVYETRAVGVRVYIGSLSFVFNEIFEERFRVVSRKRDFDAKRVREGSH